MSSCKNQVSRTVRLRKLSWLGHPSLQLRRVADVRWSSASGAPDVSSAEHHQLHHGSGRCSAAFHPPEVDDAPTQGAKGTSRVLPKPRAVTMQGCSTLGWRGRMQPRPNCSSVSGCVFSCPSLVFPNQSIGVAEPWPHRCIPLTD